MAWIVSSAAEKSIEFSYRRLGYTGVVHAPEGGWKNTVRQLDPNMIVVEYQR